MKNTIVIERINKLLNILDDSNLYPPFYEISGVVNEPSLTVDGQEYLTFCANNYLSLTNEERVIDAAISTLRKTGVGPGGSRVISGNAVIINDLEKKIADLTGTEDCLTFPTGYMANIAVFKAMMDPFIFDLPCSSKESVIFSDEYNHGSIVDGCKLSSAEKVIFRHDDIDDLYRKIKSCGKPNKLIVTEGVFSLEGEIINIPKYIEIKEETDSLLMVDDAHGVGLLGKNGGGIGEYHNCSSQIDILMGCLDKAMGGTGGYLCGKKELMRYLRIGSRSSILSSAIPTGMAGAMIESISIIKEAQQLRKKLFENARYLRDGLLNLGFTILGNDNLPAIPLFLGKDGDAVEFSKLLFEGGIYLPPIRFPAVKTDMARLRIIVMTGHKRAHFDQLISACERAGRELNLI